MSEVEGVGKLVTQEAMSAFETVVWKRGKNVHNDPEEAASAGISAPFASGMMQLAFMHEFLHGRYGERWDRGGSISARWLGLVFAGDVIEVSVRPASVDPSDAWWHSDGAEVLEVSCTNQAGTRTAVATAEIVADRTIQNR